MLGSCVWAKYRPLKKLTFSLVTSVAAIGFLLNLFAASSDAQQRQNNAGNAYAEAQSLLENYRRESLDYGTSRQNAIEKVRKLCAEYSDRISVALDHALKAENQGCRANPNCEKASFKNYDEMAIRIINALKEICASREKGIDDFYNGKEREKAQGGSYTERTYEQNRVYQGTAIETETNRNGKRKYDPNDPKNNPDIRLIGDIRINQTKNKPSEKKPKPPLKATANKNEERNLLDWGPWHSKLGGGIIYEFDAGRKFYPTGSSCQVKYKVSISGAITIIENTGSSKDFRDFCRDVFENVNSYHRVPFPQGTHRQYVIKSIYLYNTDNREFKKVLTQDEEDLDKNETFHDFTKAPPKK